MLDWIKVLDFTRLLPYPLATHILAHPGAEVVSEGSCKNLKLHIVGYVTIISALFGSILIGMGIGYGVYVFSR